MWTTLYVIDWATLARLYLWQHATIHYIAKECTRSIFWESAALYVLDCLFLHSSVPAASTRHPSMSATLYAINCCSFCTLLPVICTLWLLQYSKKIFQVNHIICDRLSRPSCALIILTLLQHVTKAYTYTIYPSCDRIIVGTCFPSHLDYYTRNVFGSGCWWIMWSEPV